MESDLVINGQTRSEVGEEEEDPGINHSAEGRVKKLIKRDDQSVSLSSPQIISAKADDPKSEKARPE